jgi:hypothetical protein
LEFKLNDDGATYSVSAYTRGNPAVVIPDTYNGKPVTSIADNVFKDRTDIKSVQFGANIETIGANAFDHCTKLANLICSDSNIKTVGNYAFKDCRSLTGIDLSKAENIGSYAFKNCYSLVSINLPEAEKIGSYAFESCSKLKTASFSTSITEISDGLFRYCSSLTTLKNVGELTAIGYGAFYQTNIVGINSDNVINLGDKIKSIGYMAFYFCRNLIEFKANSSDYVSEDGVLYQITSDGLSLINYPTNKSGSVYVIDENTVSVQSYAFLEVNKLEAVKLCGKLTTISNTAFSACKSLKTVLIGNSVTEIGNSAFAECTALEQVMIGTDDDVAQLKIGSDVFYGCENLSKIIYSAYSYEWNNIVSKSHSWNKNTSDKLSIIFGDNDKYATYAESILNLFE